MSDILVECSFKKCKFPKKLIVLLDPNHTKKMHDGKPYHDVCLVKHLVAESKKYK
jgi:hypothetical protein